MSIHRYFLHNGDIREAGEASLFAGQLGLARRMGCFQHFARSGRRAVCLGKALGSHVARRPVAERRNAGRSGCGRAGYPPPDRGESTRRTAPCGWSWCATPAACGRARRAVLPSDTIALTADLKNWGESIRLGDSAACPVRRRRVHRRQDPVLGARTCAGPSARRNRVSMKSSC